MYILIAILVFGGLIFFHELGHFLFAKRHGILVHEFAIGLGPRLLAWRRGETLFTVRLFALFGGFVRMAGMDPSEDELTDGQEPPAADHQKFRLKRPGQRAAVLAAGPMANLVVAVIVFALVFGPIGVTYAVSDEPIIGGVVSGMPADVAGLRPGDRIAAVDGIAVNTWEQMTELIRARLGQETRLVVERGEQQVLIDVTPAPHEAVPGAGMIGISPEGVRMHLPWYEAIWVAIQRVFLMVISLLAAVGQMIVGKGATDVAGPVGIVSMVRQASAIGVESVLELAGALSVTLAVFNLLPLPALDGGRLLFIAIERLRGRPVDPQRENFIHFVGFALLLLLSVFIAFRDIQRFVV